MTDGTLNAWGKNDKGQMGVTPGIGIDMVESENVPTTINLLDAKGQFKEAKNFAIGPNTMLIQDTDNQLYQTGLKLHYEPKPLKFDTHVLDIDQVQQIYCGKRNYTILTKDNYLLVWGNVFKLDETE